MKLFVQVERILQSTESLLIKYLVSSRNYNFQSPGDNRIGDDTWDRLIMSNVAN
jgi:hypothetical protein